MFWEARLWKATPCAVDIYEGPISNGLPRPKPFIYTLSKGEPFGFAGLWDVWKEPATGEWLQTFAIITTNANELTGKVHDRMPVILHSRDYDRWLQRGEAHQLPVDLLRPYEADEMRAEAYNPAVGNVRNNGPELLECPNPDEPTALLNSR